MHSDRAAAMLAELGHPTRLACFRLLVQAGPDGAPVGTLQDHLGIPASTLSHHLARLVAVGLVEQRRDGRILHCHPRIGELDRLLDFLRSECCRGL